MIQMNSMDHDLMTSNNKKKISKQIRCSYCGDFSKININDYFINSLLISIDSSATLWIQKTEKSSTFVTKTVKRRIIITKQLFDETGGFRNNE